MTYTNREEDSRMRQLLQLKEEDILLLKKLVKTREGNINSSIESCKECMSILGSNDDMIEELNYYQKEKESLEPIVNILNTINLKE